MSCQHDSTLLDTSAGDEICVNCGQILIEKVINGIDYPLHGISEREETQASLDSLEDYVSTLLNRAHLPPCFSHDVIQLYQAKASGYNDVLMVVCLGEILNNQGVPFSLKELSDLSGVGIRKLTSVQKKYFPFTHRPIKPSQMINRLGAKLGLNRRHCMKLQTWLEDLEKRLCFTKNPLSVCAAILWRYNELQSLHLSFKMVSKICQVSDISIRRALVRYQKELANMA